MKFYKSDLKIFLKKSIQNY